MMIRKTIGLIFMVLIMFPISGYSQTTAGRWETDLSGSCWSLWLDRAALWYNDSAYLPPVDISKLDINPPTCGWENLHNRNHTNDNPSIDVKVPGTVEEHYWGRIGGAIPDTGGNYVGVSWWSRKFKVGPELQGKRVTLCFDAVNLRAEVFVNEKLVGYDAVGNTPFDVDITKALLFGEENYLDIRITDPVGNFSWNDNILMRWGNNLVPAVHGFGGITGPVVMRATDAVFISDVYVQNQPDPKKVEIFVTLNNSSDTRQRGSLAIKINERTDAGKVVWKKKMNVTLNGNEKDRVYSFEARVPEAKLWELAPYQTIRPAVLYNANALFSSNDRIHSDLQVQKFGFRWFDVGESEGDKRFYLNGKRVFLLAAMVRGFWPTNGMFPTKEMLKREEEMMVKLGMNTMYMHRAIGRPEVFDYADSLGMFAYEEPGGYRILENRWDNIEGPDQLSRSWRREKLKRMVIRDRSNPSLVIYYLKNEATNAPDSDDVLNMKLVHSLDPSRIVNYNSGNSIGRGKDPQKEAPDDPTKLHILPYNTALNYYGWWDQHHWFSYSGYVDEMYRNPEFYLRGVINGARSWTPQDSLYRLDKKEVIFWGEEGAFGTMVRLQKIKEELDRNGDKGFREKEHKDWYEYYDRFLDESGFRESYPTVDDLTLSMGRNLAYFHGRNIENVRLSNIGDAYSMNGWGSASTRTDVVDMYRNSTAEPDILSQYTKPVYIAVKVRNKVVPSGFSPVADFFIINEVDLKGTNTLSIALADPHGKDIFNEELEVKISGGETFGELLARDIRLPVLKTAGYYKLRASINAGNGMKVSGSDSLFVVNPETDAREKMDNIAVVENIYSMSDWDSPIDKLGNIAVVEDDGLIGDYLQKTYKLSVTPFSVDLEKADKIIIGNKNFKDINEQVLTDIFTRVSEGAELIVLENADLFGERLNQQLRNRPVVYGGGGIQKWNGGGRLFVGKSKLLEGLPESQGMSWEYQCFYKVTDRQGGNGQVSGIDLDRMGTEIIVAMGNQGRKEILTSLGRVKYGTGSVLFSTLNILPNLQTDEMSSVVAKKLFLNILKY